MRRFEIRRIRDHYEAYDEYGEFIVSGDTYDECRQFAIEELGGRK